MLKIVARAMIGAFVGALFIGGAFAFTGTVPNDGAGLVDGTYVKGIAKGINDTYIYGISAAGTNQATATQLNPNFKQVEIDTAASGTGVALPTSVQAMEILIYNNGANTVDVYPAIANNPATGSQDTINGTTSTTIAAKAGLIVWSTKTGVWAAH